MESLEKAIYLASSNDIDITLVAAKQPAVSVDLLALAVAA